jgi:hypothetical protein
MYVLSGCCICCISYTRMLHVYISNVSSISDVCVKSVLSVCLKCYNDYTCILQVYVSNISSVSNVCCKCFIGMFKMLPWLYIYVASVYTYVEPYVLNVSPVSDVCCGNCFILQVFSLACAICFMRFRCMLCFIWILHVFYLNVVKVYLVLQM